MCVDCLRTQGVRNRCSAWAPAEDLVGRTKWSVGRGVWGETGAFSVERRACRLSQEPELVTPNTQRIEPFVGYDNGVFVRLTAGDSVRLHREAGAEASGEVGDHLLFELVLWIRFLSVKVEKSTIESLQRIAREIHTGVRHYLDEREVDENGGWDCKRIAEAFAAYANLRGADSSPMSVVDSFVSSYEGAFVGIAEYLLMGGSRDDLRDLGLGALEVRRLRKRAERVWGALERDGVVYSVSDWSSDRRQIFDERTWDERRRTAKGILSEFGLGTLRIR